MSKFILCILISLFLTGCASCSAVTNVKATAITSPKDFKINSNIMGLYIELPNKFDLTIRNCSGQYNSSICASITVESDVHVRFSSSQIVTKNIESNKKEAFEISSIQYSYLCNTKKGKETICDSSATSPTSEPTTVVADNNRMAYGSDDEIIEQHVRSFKPTLEFVGAKVKCWCAQHARVYNFILINEQLLKKPPIKATLPNIYVDGHEYVLPEINFSTATEEFCYHPELM
ncbi:MAG: hypothetical protein ACO1N8_09650 [Methylophilus sp.]